MSTSIQARTLASSLNAPRKDGQDARAFRAVSLPDRITRRQDAANEYQHSGTNLGFVSECPKERRAGCPCFP